MTPEGDLPERRHLTILFSDLSDSTRISSTMEPELYDELLQQLRLLFLQIVSRHGGRIVRLDGDGVLCVFGYPEACENAGRRATEAAIDLHQAALALDQALGVRDHPIRLHSGIHSGVVLVRSGDIVRGWIEIVGDATNLAAHLCDEAAADQILVSDAALGADRLFYTTAPRRLTTTRGHPLQAFQILGRELVETRYGARLRRGVTAFEGRAAELDQLAWHLETTSSRARVVAVIGSPGIGKSRLIGEFADIASRRGSAVYSGYCESYLGARPLQPFTQIARSILLAMGKAPDAEPDVEAPAGPVQLAGTLIALLDAAAESEPQILSVDDWQWADDASRQCLETLVEQLRRPVLILLSSRTRDIVDDPHLRPHPLYLPPLSRVEAKSAIEGLLTLTDPFLVERICDRAGGNPLFIEELCHGARIGDAHYDVAKSSGWIDMLVQARLALLSPKQVDLIRTASIIGPVFATSLFEALTGITTDSAELAELIAEDLLYDGEVPGTLRFKHGIVRDAVYAGVGLAARRQGHGRVASALLLERDASGSDVHIEALAYHFGAAADHERGFEFSMLAGDAAMAVSALDRAQALYQAAYDALAPLPPAHDLWQRFNDLVGRYGRACVIDPSRDQLPILESMAVRARQRRDAEGAALAEYWLGTVHYGLGDARPSIRHLEAARRLTEETGRESLLAQIVAGLGQSHGIACHYPTAIGLLEKAIALKRPHWQGTRPSPGLAYLAATRGLLHADAGAFAEAETWFEQGIGYLIGRDHQVMASIRGHQIAARLWQDDYAGAVAMAARCTQVAERVRARYLFAISRALAAYATWRIDGEAQAVSVMLKETEWLNQRASRQRISLLYGWLAEIMASLKRFEEARFYARLALWRARHGDRLGEACSCRTLARIAAQTNSKRGATHYLTRAAHSATLRGSRHEHARNAVCAAEIALVRGERQQALHLIQRAEAELIAMDMRHELARAGEIRAAT